MSRSYRKPYYKDGNHKGKQAASRRYRRVCKQIAKVYTKHFDFWDYMYEVFDDDDICCVDGIYFHLTKPEYNELIYGDGEIYTNDLYRDMILNPKNHKKYVEPNFYYVEFPHPYEITNPWDVRDYRIHIKPYMWKFNGDFHGYYENDSEYKMACRK